MNYISFFYFYFYLLFSYLTLCLSKVYRGFNDVTRMPISVSDMTATIVEQSIYNDKRGPRVYVIGGCSGNQLCPLGEFCYCTEVTNSCNIFFIESQTWTPCAPAPTARCRHSAVYFDGKIYLFGGRDITDTLIQDVDIFYVISGQWLSAFTWFNATSDGSAFTDDISIYLVGGYDANYAPLASLTQYIPSSSQWNYALPSMAFPRGDLGAIAVPKNYKDASLGFEYYVIGGFAYDICNPLSVVETYDSNSQTWTTRIDLNEERADMALGVLDGFLFTVAGETKDHTCDSTSYLPGISIPVNDVERLEKIDGTWNYEENIPNNRFRFVAASYKDAIYLFGGQGDLITENTDTPYHQVLNTTMLYVPKSIADKRDLNDGEIAGIVIGCVIFVGSLIVAGILYCGYQKYRGYSKPTDDADEQKEKAVEVTMVQV